MMKKRTKKTLQLSLKVFTRLLLASVLCAILYVSMNVISTAFFSDVVGYQIYMQDEDQTVTLKTEYFYQDGEEILTADDMELADNEAFSAIREVSAPTKRVMDTLTQILLLIVWCVFPYHILWEFGNRDDTNVRYRGQRPDPLRGVKIGLLAVVPYGICWAMLLVSKFVPALDGFLSIYRLTAFPYYPYVNWLTAGVSSAAELELWRLLLLLIPIILVVPAVSAVAYRLGGHQFSVAEFLTFAKPKETQTEDEI